MKRDYNDSDELRYYIRRNYRHAAFTAREQSLLTAAILELKARHARFDSMAARLRQKSGYFYDAEVSAIIESGVGAFQDQCYDRLLRNHRDQIYINRCERCQRILASPIACACTWCGHHWYDSRAEMIARAASSVYPKP